MFSFLTSYLPPLSSLPLPSLPQNLQPRLLSFLLRRAVGSFVKGGLNPSQDGDQVKADLAKGTISVNNLELDPNVSIDINERDRLDTPMRGSIILRSPRHRLRSRDETCG